MTPAEFLALSKSSAAEQLLTLHTRAGNFEALPYRSLLFVTGEEAGGMIRLIFPQLAVILRSQRLGPVFDAIRTHIAAHLFEFIPERHDPLEPGEPVITTFVFEVESPKQEDP